MSPKSVPISLLLLFLTLASLTLSSAATDNGCGHESVSALLKYYELPGGIFPNNVKDFNCDPDTYNEAALKLRIELKDICPVTKGALVNVDVDYQREIFATISPRKLSSISGVTFMLTAVTFNYPTPRKLPVNEVEVLESIEGKEKLQIRSNPNTVLTLPNDFFSELLTCKSSSAAALDYLGSARVVAAKDNQDVPMWIYKYGRLLPLVAA